MRSAASKTPDPPQARREHQATTHHLENPEEGHEVAGLRSVQLEEVHGDDGERDHEESWEGEGLPGHLRAAGRRAHLPSAGLGALVWLQ